MNNELKKLSEFLNVLSEENRLKIICLLGSGRKCVCEIYEHLDLPQNLVSHHLKILKDFNILSSKKEGLKVYYELNTKILEKYLDILNQYLNNKGEKNDN